MVKWLKGYLTNNKKSANFADFFIEMITNCLLYNVVMTTLKLKTVCCCDCYYEVCKYFLYFIVLNKFLKYFLLF